MNKLARILPLAGLFTLSSLLSSCGNDQAAGGKDKAGQNEVKAYPVLRVSNRSTTLYSDFPTVLQGQQDVEIRPKADGFLEQIAVDEGSLVKKGQLLFRINSDQFAQRVSSAQANVKMAQASVDAARLEVKKVRSLVEKNIVSKFELESAEYTLESKEAALAQAKANLMDASTNLAYTTITSPSDGVVGSIPYKVGSLVSSNTPQPLTIISNTSNVYAYFSLNEKQLLGISRNSKGNTLQEKLANMPDVSLILADGSAYTHPGKVTTATGLINTTTGSVNMRAVFPNQEGLLRSGASGTVRIPTQLDSAIIIPQKATYELQGKRFAYVLGADGKVSSVEVRINELSNNQFFVVEEGLKAGDKIVLEGIASLHDDTQIIPKPVNSDSVYSAMSQNVNP